MTRIVPDCGEEAREGNRGGAAVVGSVMTETSASSAPRPSSSGRLVGVTGATGAVGGRVAAALAEAGVAQRLLVRDPSRAPELAGAEVVRMSYGDHEASVAALRGVDVLFMVSAAEAPDRRAQHLDVVAAAAEAGVGHVAYTSFQGAAPDAVFTLARDHWATEEALRASGAAVTILRDSFYLDVLPEFADEQGVLRGPAGTGRVAAVARADVADVAAAVLLDPEAHVGAVHELTGSEAVTLDEAAARLTAVLGRPFSFVDETVDEAYASRQRWQPEPWQADAWVSTYTSIASDEVSRVTTAVRDVAGHEPLTIETLFGAQGA
jgi:NAD(P)H dehydrogenase (quinone)